jgi:hypothetical protein
MTPVAVEMNLQISRDERHFDRQAAPSARPA